MTDLHIRQKLSDLILLSEKQTQGETHREIKEMRNMQTKVLERLGCLWDKNTDRQTDRKKDSETEIKIKGKCKEGFDKFYFKPKEGSTEKVINILV